LGFRPFSQKTLASITFALLKKTWDIASITFALLKKTWDIRGNSFDLELRNNFEFIPVFLAFRKWPSCLFVFVSFP